MFNHKALQRTYSLFTLAPLVRSKIRSFFTRAVTTILLRRGLSLCRKAEAYGVHRKALRGCVHHSKHYRLFWVVRRYKRPSVDSRSSAIRSRTVKLSYLLVMPLLCSSCIFYSYVWRGFLS